MNGKVLHRKIKWLCSRSKVSSVTHSCCIYDLQQDPMKPSKKDDTITPSSSQHFWDFGNPLQIMNNWTPEILTGFILIWRFSVWIMSFSDKRVIDNEGWPLKILEMPAENLIKKMPGHHCTTGPSASTISHGIKVLKPHYWSKMQAHYTAYQWRTKCESHSLMYHRCPKVIIVKGSIMLRVLKLIQVGEPI